MKIMAQILNSACRTAVMAFAFVMAVPVLTARIDKKFYNKAASLVWGTRSELFDSGTEIPDSIAGKESAVVIAEYVNVDVDYENYQNAMHSANISKRKFFTRRMLKLMDNAAVEKFSEFEFGGKAKVTDIIWLPVAKMETAFGVRVHKSDGSIIDVDLSTALPITKGKKGAEKDALGYKVAVPDLKPGDVIDYFNYSEEWVDEYSLQAIPLYFSQSYPVLNYLIEGTFSPKITVEYHSYNGAPEFNHSIADNKKNCISLFVHDIPVVNDERGIRRARQLPFIKLQTLNNTSAYVFRPRHARKGGVYSNLQPLTIYGDISNVLSRSSYDSSKIPGKIRKLANEYFKTHTDATAEEKRDATWLASLYVSLTGKEDADRFWLSLIYRDLLEKLKLTDDLATPPEVGFVNSRNEVPTSQISAWDDPDYVCIVGKDVYMIPPSYHYVPREMPGDYQGEPGGKFASQPSENGRRAYSVVPTEFAISTTKVRDNGASVRMSGKISEDGHSYVVSHDFTFNGTAKSLVREMTNLQEWAKEVEEYLGIPAGKGYKDSGYDTAERGKEIAEELEDFVENFYREKPENIENIQIHSRGITPDKRNFRLTFDASHRDLGSTVGNGEAIMLNVGRLVSNNHRYDGYERHRMLDYYRMSPEMWRYEINLEIPDGYAVDPESAEKFTTNVKNRSGAFFAKCDVAEDGRSITVQVAERYDNYVVEVEKWEELLSIFDAAANFNDASIMLVKQ